MLKTGKEYYTSYQPQHHRSRFWISAESCYTDNELEQRAWILNIRANSGIHTDYLMNPNSWFGDDSQALVNIYEHSWLLSHAFKTRHMLTRDDFYVRPLDGQRLQWPALYELMQKTGDYLILRNRKLPKDHLNQPMNFFFLDLNNILKGISQNPNIQQTREQLEFLTHYVHAIEKNISPANSDRLFLANFRRTIDDKIQPLLSYRIESQLLKDRLDELSKTIDQLSMERNRILHFALNPKQVNPHPYTFQITHVDDLKNYPTQMVKECHKNSLDLVNNPTFTISLTAKQLQDCPHFELINMQDEVVEHYAKAISNLYELGHFQKIITQTIELLGQAGEVYTVFQFKEQLSLLLKQIDSFIHESSIPIEEITNINTYEYHKAILRLQESSFIEKWLTSKREKLNIFIKNQDILNQYPSTVTELSKTTQILKKQANHILTHLNDPKKRGADLAALTGKAQELNTLMDSMHHPSFFKSKKDLPIANVYQNLNYFYETPRFLMPAKQLQISAFPDQGHHTEYLKFIAFIPLGFVVLYLIYRALNKSKTKVDTLSNKHKSC